jgi:hypothetical protein
VNCDDGVWACEEGEKLARKPVLHTVDQLVLPAVERTIKAVGPPESDAALCAVLRVLAATIDHMSLEERARMVGQTAPALQRALGELEDRRRRREGPDVVPRVENPVDSMRRAHATRALRGA